MVPRTSLEGSWKKALHHHIAVVRMENISNAANYDPIGKRRLVVEDGQGVLVHILSGRPWYTHQKVNCSLEC